MRNFAKRSLAILLAMMMVFTMFSATTVFAAETSVILTEAEQSAVAAVIAQIDALNVSSVDDKATVQAARNAYNALNDAQKASVTNLDKLENAEYTIARFEGVIPVDIQFRDMDSVYSLAGGGGTLSAKATVDTSKHLEGTGAAKLTAKNGGTGLYMYVYAENYASGASLPIAGGQYLAFDLYVSDASVLKASTASVAINMGNVDAWDGNAYGAVAKNNVVAFFAGLKDGWNQIVLPIDRTAATTDSLQGIRIYNAGAVLPAGFTVMVDDVRVLSEVGRIGAFKDRAVAKAASIALYNIPALDALTYEDKTLVDAAAAAVASVKSDYAHFMVADTAILSAAQARIDELALTAGDRAAAAAVDAQIAALDVLSLDDKAAVEAARAAYTALTNTQKLYVTKLADLKAAEDAIAQMEYDAECAIEVENMILALPATITLTDKDAVQAVRDAFNGLTENQQYMVHHTETLEAAEKTIALLEFVADFTAKVDALPDAKDVTTADHAAIADVLAQYDEMNAEEKAAVSAETVAKLDALKGAISKNGPVDGYFYQNGKRLNAYQVVEFNGDYYFISDGNKIATNTIFYMSATFIGKYGLDVGYYSFDADGKMTPYTGFMYGKFYKDAVLQQAYQVIEFNGAYYFISDSHSIAKNCRYYMSNWLVSSVGLPAGYYTFDSEGKMSPYTGIVLYQFYKDAVLQEAYQVVKFDGDYYFISDGHFLAHGVSLYLHPNYVKNVDLKAGYYTFDHEGKIVGTVTGMYNGKYFVDGMQQNAYQVIEHGNNYYFISDGNKIATNTVLYMAEYFVGKVGLPAGDYCFDKDGKMTPKEGIMKNQFYRDGVLQTAYQVVNYQGNYYFISDGNKIARDTTVYLANWIVEGSGLPAGTYTIDVDGKIIL